MIAIEAFAATRPVVCARVGAAAEVVNADTGVLVDPGPQEAARFAAALDDLLSNPQRRQTLGLAGRRLVENEYDAARARRAYREILHALLERTELR
jgi:glycosyltransferase involved in cell wall biosynthesis